MTLTMPRPPKTDRSTVRDILITLKLSKAEKETLLACVADRSRELEENSGERIEVTASSDLRWLIDRDAKGRKLDGKGAKAAKPAAAARKRA